jgi:folate-dependent phosphoribosylglycinamide formyltransferase PurN
MRSPPSGVAQGAGQIVKRITGRERAGPGSVRKGGRRGNYFGGLAYPPVVRIALFGSGSPQSLRALARLRAAAEVVAVVVPRAEYARPLVEAGGREVVEFGDGLAATLRVRGVEQICVASFPRLLRGELLEIPALNAHLSLLPRHRGADPLFWTYYCADAQTGVTIHALDAGCDTGDVVVQRALPLPRAKPSRETYFELADVAAELLVHALTDPTRIAQDESGATADPPAPRGSVRVDFGAWPVARAWHFLAGLCDQRNDLVAGHPHGRALEWRDGTSRVPGSIVETRRTLEVHCRDGVVVLERAQRGLLRRIVSRFLR